MAWSYPASAKALTRMCFPKLHAEIDTLRKQRSAVKIHEIILTPNSTPDHTKPALSPNISQ